MRFGICLLGGALWLATGMPAALLGQPLPPNLATTRLAFAEAPFAPSSLEEIRSVTLSRDGALLATSAGNLLSVWDAARGRRLRTFAVPPHASFALSPNGKTILMCGSAGEGRMALLNLSTGRQVWERRTSGNTGAHFTPDGQRLLAIGSSPTPGRQAFGEVLDARTGQGRLLEGGETGFSLVYGFSPDRRHAVFQGGGKGETVLVGYVVASGRESFRLRPGSLVLRLAIGPEGKRVATVEREGPVHLWSTATGRREASLSEPAYSTPPEVAFSPDGATLVTYPEPWRLGDPEGPMRLWNPRSGRPGLVLSGAEGMFLPVFSRDGRLLAARSATKIRIWRLNTGLLLHTFPAPALRVTFFSRGLEAPHAFSTDGTTLTAAGENEVRRWDLKSGRLQGAFPLAAPGRRSLQVGPGRAAPQKAPISANPTARTS